MKKYDENDLQERIILSQYDFFGKVIVYGMILICVGIILCAMLE